ncbi:glycolipid transfer protein-like [Corticium candelabrum]|uniref:glycolipid transfer protein-like n=1 Tax=Corticium candelabrum TaxID=121492 RepID=UPI002E2660CF|nr:glycolipid transfer protein-like [Corticium candelabrum]
MTFFASLRHGFLPVPADGRIDTRAFLDAAREIVPFFDVLGPTAFAPVKSDINGNIKKLQKKHDEDAAKYTTLQGIVESEMEEGTTKAKNSATDALLWLKRALQFICVFLEKVLDGEEDLTKCARAAYEASLKRFHGWIVRGVFALAVRAVPYRKDFIKALQHGTDVGEEAVLFEMREHMSVLSANVEVLSKFYIDKGQDSDKTV